MDVRRGISRASEAVTWLVAAGLGMLLLHVAALRPASAPDAMSLGMTSAAPAGGEISALDAMIGQMLMVGFYGQSPSEGWVRRLQAQIHAGKVGGVIIMDQNIASRTQVQRLNAALHGAEPPLPLLVAIDQEGGAVQRLGPRQGIGRLPGAARMARQGSAEAAGARYADLAAGLKALGFNLNFGPVVDLARNRDNPIITRQGRSFGSDPATVSAFARAFIRAHRQAGVLTAAKHFPGHGSSAGDSHVRLADVSKSWSDIEIEPYKLLNATEPPPLVMVGHLYLDRFGKTAKTPATLSRDAVEGMLRGEIGYQGVVITDDLDMGAIRRSYKLEDAAVLAIKAGNDMILVSNTSRPDPNLPERLIARIRGAILDGTIPRQRIEQAFARIQYLKSELAGARPVLAGPR